MIVFVPEFLFSGAFCRVQDSLISLLSRDVDVLEDSREHHSSHHQEVSSGLLSLKLTVVIVAYPSQTHLAGCDEGTTCVRGHWTPL